LSEGYTCPKGGALPQMHHHPDRGRTETARLATGHIAPGPVAIETGTAVTMTADAANVTHGWHGR